MAGMHKHKWSYTVKYAPDHFGHNIFRPPNRTLTRRWLNVGDLAMMEVPKDQILDLGSLGFDKLLGQGTVSKAFSLKVPRASASALEKIKLAGGSVQVENSPAQAKANPSTKTSKGEKSNTAPATAKI
jgi:large subunit ribosomal protein L15